MNNNKNNLKKGAEANGISPFDFQYYPKEGSSNHNTVDISEKTRKQIEEIKSRKVKLKLGEAVKFSFDMAA